MESTPALDSEGKAIVRVLSVVLERLVSANSHLAQSDQGQVTKFHALRAPAIGVGQYLERIQKYASCSNECFILALIYIDRLIQRNNFLLTELNVHRVVITAILLAAKFFDDAYYNNAYYAKVGGVLVSEMNSLEVEFLFRINFSLRVMPDVFEKYNAELISHANALGLQSPPPCNANVLFHEPTEPEIGATPQLHVPTNNFDSSSGYACGNIQLLNFQDQQERNPVAHPAHQTQYQQQNQNFGNKGIKAPMTQQPIQNPSQITPSPPPHQPSNACNHAAVNGNNDAYCYVNSSDQQHHVNDYNTQGPSNDSAFDLHQQPLINSSTSHTWTALCNAHDASESQGANLTLTPSTIQVDHLPANYSSSSAPPFTNVQYSNVPFPSLPAATTPLSTTYSAKSSPGVIQYSDHNTRPIHCTHSRYGSVHGTEGQTQVMHHNYSHYVHSDIGMGFQKIYFTPSSVTDPIRSHAQYAMSSPQVES
mmetsp:Transcript_9783/g.20157  ORF Transcript_9783/g.20157 Transcript_9783/m.20157 type:complete len:479 (-) Transcript_9783:227-1663(-)